MKSHFPCVELGKHIRQVSQRNRANDEIEVFSVTNSEGFTKSTDYFSKEVFSKDVSNYKVVSPGQFAYNPSRINVGSIDYLRHGCQVLVSPLYIVFKGGNDIYADYLLRYLKSDWGNAQIRANTEGAVRDSLKFRGMENIKLPLPSLEDQKRIAYLLGKVEGLIARRKQHLQQLDNLLNSVFLEMFGDPVRNEKGWDKPELKQFGKISTGNTPPRNDPSNYASQHIEWIKTDNISTDSVSISQAAEYLSETGATRARTVTKGALMVACIAGSVESIGRAALTNRTVAFNQQINAIQPKKDVNPFYLYVLFKISKAYIQSHASKGMKKILTKGDFEKITMIKPPVDLQNQFAAIVEKVEALKSRYQQSIADLKILYGALSQRAFKGELDLSQVNVKDEVGIIQLAEMEVVAMPELKEKNLINLSTPEIGQIEYLTKSNVRSEMLKQWLQEYLDQIETYSNISVECFIQAAQKKLWELNQDGLFEPVGDFESFLDLSAEDYEKVKSWVFEALSEGKIEQTRNEILIDGKPELGNQIVLRKSP